MRYFLLGTYGIDLFYKKDYRSLADNKNKWNLVSYNPNLDDITELLEHVVGCDAYLELLESDVNEIDNAIDIIDKQNRDFNRFFHAYMKQQISDQFNKQHTGFN